MTNLNSKVSWAIFIVFFLLVLGVTGYYFYKYYQDTKKTDQTITSTTEDLNKIIKQYAMSSSDKTIVKDVTITFKKTYVDAQGATWLKFNITPIPVTATDPAYGFMKKEKGKSWVGISFGTCCNKTQLPADVQKAFGYTSDLTADWKTYTQTDFSIKYPKSWYYTIPSEIIEFKEEGKPYYIEGSEIGPITLMVQKNDGQSLTQIANSMKVGTTEIVDITLDSINAKKITSYLATSIVVINNNKVYTLQAANLGSESANAPILDIFTKMLSTFTFTK